MRTEVPRDPRHEVHLHAPPVIRRQPSFGYKLRRAELPALMEDTALRLQRGRV